MGVGNSSFRYSFVGTRQDENYNQNYQNNQNNQNNQEKQKPENYRESEILTDNSKVDDGFGKIYRSLNWNISCIGGSFALRSFMIFKFGPQSWKSKDLDIFIKCDTEEEFQKEANEFEQKSGVELVKSVWYPSDPSEREKFVAEKGVQALQDESFHRAIRGSKSYTFQKEIPDSENHETKIPVQLVCISGDPESRTWRLNPNMSVEEILREMVDYPSCVTFKVQDGTKIYTVPKTAMKMLETKRIPSCLICPSRMQKYQERGFEFYPWCFE